MMRIISDGTRSRVIRGLTASTDIEAALIPASLPYEAYPATYKTIRDAIIEIGESVNGIIPNFKLDLDLLDALGATVQNNSPSICSYDPVTGMVTRIADGYANLNIKSEIFPQRVKRYIGVSPGEGSRPTQHVSGYMAGSLARHFLDTAIALTSGKTASATTKQLFSTNSMNAASPDAVRNANCFAASLDLTPISCATGNNSDFAPGCLITRRHIYGAAHYGTPGPVVWLGNDGQYHTANVLRAIHHPGDPNQNNDIRIAYLDREIPATVSNFQVMPAGWKTDHLPVLADTPAVRSYPVFIKTANYGANLLNVAWWSHYIYAEGLNYTGPSGAPVLAGDMAAWSPTTIKSGDSGSPYFVSIGGRLALLGTLYGASGGADPSNYIAGINTALNNLRDPGDTIGYSLDIADLSGFVRY